ncbi:hypothetical protein LIER_24550 [Lithospermum erythrorhizon]|uniref:RNase H type-1 domain-containing protein n=1 Tax=Lithospermum erythrorhizon TaxID=34254 RepID=A0AAV3R1P4_LITER
MPRIDPEVATHKLYIDTNFTPVKKKKRLFNDEKNVAIREQVQALLKEQAIRKLKFPACIANVVLLQGGLKTNRVCRALNRFISKSRERNPPFFKKLRRMSKERFVWDEDCREAFEELKRYLGSPQLLSRPEPGEWLQLYLAISDVAVSSVLLREVAGVKKPIHYVSHVIRDVEERYPIIDKAAFALIISARKLKAYFETYPIQMVTDQSLKRVLSSPTLSGRLTTWPIELSEFEISYVPRTSVRAQALANFITECTARAPRVIQGPQTEASSQIKPEWTLFVDGARNDQGAGTGVLILGPREETMEYALRFRFPTTNNEATFEAMILGLRLVKSMGVEELLVKGDSKLVIDHIRGCCGVTNEKLMRYHIRTHSQSRK